MTETTWRIDASDGELLVRTGVTGRAARMGHRLTIAMTQWRATVDWGDGEPVGVELTVDVDSLEVLRGDGGVKALSGPEKVLVRSNALGALDSRRFPRICFTADAVERTDGGYRLAGALQIHGKTRERVIDVATDDLGDSWRMSGQATVRQSDFGVKPYSLLMGALKVADDVTVSFTASRTKDD